MCVAGFQRRISKPTLLSFFRPAKIEVQVGDSSSGRTTDSGSVSRGSNPRSPASMSVAWRIRLAAKDTTLSRWRPRVRIPYALPTIPSHPTPPDATTCLDARGAPIPGLCRAVWLCLPDSLAQIAPQELASDNMQVGVRLALHPVASEVG